VLFFNEVFKTFKKLLLNPFSQSPIFSEGTFKQYCPNLHRLCSFGEGGDIWGCLAWFGSSDSLRDKM